MTRQSDDGEPRSSWKIFAVVRRSAGTRFGIAHLLDPGAIPGSLYTDGTYDVSTHIDANRFTSIAWPSEQGKAGPASDGPVRTVVIGPSGHFYSVQTLAPENSAITLMETSSGGTLLQWSTRHGLEQAANLLARTSAMDLRDLERWPYQRRKTNRFDDWRIGNSGPSREDLLRRSLIAVCNG